MPTLTNKHVEHRAHMRTLRKARNNIWDIMYSIQVSETNQDADLHSLRTMLDNVCGILTDCIQKTKSLSEGGSHAHD